MRLLLDTQIAYWWQTDDPQLSREARKFVESNGDEVFVSQVSLWELAIKVSVGKLRADLAAFVTQAELVGFSWLGITNPHLMAVSELPFVTGHKDPFDRLLVSQSMSEPLVLVTTDYQLQPYGPFIRVV